MFGNKFRFGVQIFASAAPGPARVVRVSGYTVFAGFILRGKNGTDISIFNFDAV